MSHPIRTLVVGVASPDASDPALVPAVALARRLGAALHVVHAVAGVPARALDEAVRVHARGVPVTCHVRKGPPAELLCQVAREVSAELLVLGATRGRRVWRQFLGSTVEAVVRCAPAPVLVVREPAAPAVRHVLLTPDLSPAGEELHERGLDVVKALFGGDDPELRALLAVQDAGLPPVLSRAMVERIAQREIDRFLRERRPRGKAVQGRVRVGNPADEILAEAAEWQAGLIVLGVYGCDGSAGLPLDRVTGTVLRRAGASVLVVPAAAAPTDEPAAAVPLSVAG